MYIKAERQERAGPSTREGYPGEQPKRVMSVNKKRCGCDRGILQRKLGIRKKEFKWEGIKHYRYYKGIWWKLGGAVQKITAMDEKR